MFHSRSEQKTIQKSVVLTAPVDAIWRLFTDNSLLPDWAPPVQSVQCGTGLLTVGSVRRCQVTSDGVSGFIEERCVALEPQNSTATHTKLDRGVDQLLNGFKRYVEQSP